MRQSNQTHQLLESSDSSELSESSVVRVIRVIRVNRVIRAVKVPRVITVNKENRYKKHKRYVTYIHNRKKEWKEKKIKVDLVDLYLQRINKTSKSHITTNKWLYNYQYAGIISSQIPNSKIIHCYRNPLDNILSIYRTNFAKDNEYSSSLIDCAIIYLNHKQELLLQAH